MGFSWKTLGAVCGLCLAPFTGGASLTMCAACAGVGFVAGSVIEKVNEGSSGQASQAPPEAYNLLGKSIEEINKLREDLKNERKENEQTGKKLQEQLDSVRAKINNPELRQPHETEESLKKQEILLINEINGIHRRGEDITSRLKKLEQKQTQAITTGTNVASDSINATNWNNTLGNFNPSFTTKLIVAGGIVLIVYLLMVKH